MFDAYTVKKVLPRLVIAAILIQLSWPLLVMLIQITNNIAWGIEGLLYAPFGGRSALDIGVLLETGAGTGSFSALLAGGAIAGGFALVKLGALGLLSLAGAVALALLLAFFVLALRQVIIVALLVTAPIALLAWILPNTEKFWKLWWESFSKLLLMYPLILLLIAGGRIGAYLAAQGITVNTGNEVFRAVIIILVFFAPFFLIPKTFQVAGSAFANIAGIVNNRSKGAFDRLKNYRTQKGEHNMAAVKAGQRYAGGTDSNLRGRLNRGLQRGAHANKAGFNPTRWNNKINAAIGSTNQQEVERNQKENMDYITWAGNDTLNKYAAASSDTKSLRDALTRDAADVYGQYMVDDGNGGRILSAAGRQQMETDISRVESVRRSMSSRAFKQMTTLGAIAGGTAYENAGDMTAAIAAAAGDDDSALAYMVAKGKAAAMGSGRIDQGGAGFGALFSAAQKVRAGTMSAGDANQEILKNVVDNQGPGSLLHSSMKTSTAKNLAPVIRENFVKKLRAVQDASSNQDRLVAQADLNRELAKIAGTYDAMSQTSPAQAEVFAKEVMGQDLSFAPGMPGLTIQSLVEDARNDASFLQMRKEFGSGAQAEANRRNAEVAGRAANEMPGNPGEFRP